MGCNGSREPDGTSYDIERKSVPINKIEAWRSSKPLTIEEILKMRKVLIFKSSKYRISGKQG